MLNKEDVLIVKSGKESYFHQGVAAEGYKIVSSYLEGGLFLRVLREIFFRTSFLPKSIWYNKTLKKKKYSHILIWDPLITSHFLRWLAKEQSCAQLNFLYGNMVGKAKHLYPNEIPQCYRIWSYDRGDCNKYGMRFYKSNPFFKCFMKPLRRPITDVLFVGGDKGRAEFILDLENKLNSIGIITKFIIVKSSKFDKNKPFYHKPVPYDKIIDMAAESKAILNIAMPGQTGVTLRDIESLILGVKLITTNKHIVNEDFYHPNNIYILDNTNVDGIIDFLKKPMFAISGEIKHRFDFDNHINEITTSE